MLLKTTRQAAEELGISHTNLRVYINRHPELAPAKSMHENMNVWTDEEIEAVRQARATKRRPVSRK
jgi:hypothetical protein